MSTLDVAVIGASGRFPGARSVAEFWANVRGGVESIAFLDPDGARRGPASPGATVRAGGVLADADLFDAEFFALSDREATLVDPQQRVFLECAWEALESAGYDPQTYEGTIGVYAGASMSTYLINQILPHAVALGVNPLEITVSNDKDYLTTRTAYKLDLRGPSVTVQTACSTSLVAVHLAVQALLGYQCDLALAGGVTVRVPQDAGYTYVAGGLLSPDGHCRAFDAAAQGTVFGSGAGVVVLKRLADAVADRDAIRAVIKGSAVNNDGAAKVGFTALSVGAQAEVVAAAHAVAGIEPESVGYVEAHGTGTPLGDAIEVTALTQAFRAGTTGTGFCALGSVKSNVGHLEAAAGVAALIKTVAALEHAELPPSLHFERPNPHIDFDRSPFRVNTTLRPWPAGDTPRRAGVSSFGIGGANAHVVLEEAPRPAPGPACGPWHLLVVSARTPSALDRATENLRAFLREHADVRCADVAYTLQLGRRAFAHRRSVVCRDGEDAGAALATRAITGIAPDERPALAFRLPHADAVPPTVARELYDAEATFRTAVDACAAPLGSLGVDVGAGVLHPTDEHTDTVAALVAAQALARVWLGWGLAPQTLVGDGVGALAAACLADVMSLDDALALAVEWQRLLAREAGTTTAAGEPLAHRLAGISLHAPRIPCLVAGAPLTARDAADPAYWTEQLRRRERVAASGRSAGPAHGLVLDVAPEVAAGRSAPEVLLATLGRLWCAGLRPDWTALHADRGCHRVPLPTYPFERRRFWADATATNDV